MWQAGSFVLMPVASGMDCYPFRVLSLSCFSWGLMISMIPWLVSPCQSSEIQWLGMGWLSDDCMICQQFWDSVTVESGDVTDEMMKPPEAWNSAWTDQCHGQDRGDFADVASTLLHGFGTHKARGEFLAASSSSNLGMWKDYRKPLADFSHAWICFTNFCWIWSRPTLVLTLYFCLYVFSIVGGPEEAIPTHLLNW